ncbi:MAG: hypothetical protein ACHQQQ_13475 [Bacteroidota bacterium]
MEAFQKKGFWWRPSNELNRIPGILTFNPMNGIELELMGSFSELFNQKHTEPIDIILGETTDAEKITLYRCIWSGTTHMEFPKFSSSRYHAQFVFIGYLFGSVDDLVFSTFKIRYAFLEEWLGITGFEPKYLTQDGIKVTGRAITYTIPDNIKAALDGLSIELTFGFSAVSNIFKEMSIRQKTFFSIRTDKAIQFDEFIDKIDYLLRNFVALGLGRSTFPISLKITRDDIIEESSDGKTFPRYIDVYYAIRIAVDESEDIYARDMIFSYPDIQDILI